MEDQRWLGADSWLALHAIGQHDFSTKAFNVIHRADEEIIVGRMAGEAG